MSATTQAERSRKRCAAVHTALYCSMSWKKAHRDITGILLQLLGDGILTDSMGRTVSFKNTIVVMTSNLTGPQTGSRSRLYRLRGCPRADRPAGGVFSGVSGPDRCVASFRPLRQRICENCCASAAGACRTAAKAERYAGNGPGAAGGALCANDRAGPEACAAGSRPGSKARRRSCCCATRPCGRSAPSGSRGACR